MSFTNILPPTGGTYGGGSAVDSDLAESARASLSHLSEQGPSYSELAREISARRPAPAPSKPAHPAPAVFVHYPHAIARAHPYILQTSATTPLPSSENETTAAPDAASSPSGQSSESSADPENPEWLVEQLLAASIPAGAANPTRLGPSPSGGKAGAGAASSTSSPGASGSSATGPANPDSILSTAVSMVSTGNPPPDQSMPGSEESPSPNSPVASIDSAPLEGFVPIAADAKAQLEPASADAPPDPSAEGKDPASPGDPNVNDNVPDAPAAASPILPEPNLSALAAPSLEAGPRPIPGKPSPLSVGGIKTSRPGTYPFPSARPADEPRKAENPTPPKAQPPPAPSPDAAGGMGVATLSPSMKSGAEMNDFAGSGLQELPPGTSVTVTASSPGLIGGATKTVLPVEFADTRNLAFDWLISDSSAKPLSNSTLATNTTALSSAALDSLNQVERMIGREVGMVRQAGAQTLAVSLKVDSQTSLFLQLTDHNGQIEASVRCERGDLSSLAGHWSQLQESLARQNVQLLPLDNNNSPLRYPADSDSRKAETDDRQPNNPPQPRPGDETSKPNDPIGDAVRLSKSKRKPQHHHGWEKWA